MDPHRPCSSPANATCSTLFLKVIPVCLVRRAMPRIGYTARTTVASAWCLYTLGVSVRVVYMNAELVKPVLSQMSLASRNDPRWGRCLKCLSLHCIDCVSAGQGTLSGQKDQPDHHGRKRHQLACCTSFFKLLLNLPDSNPRPLMKRVPRHNAGRSMLISEEANILAHLLHQDPIDR